MAQLILGGLGVLILLLGFQTWRIDDLKDKNATYKQTAQTYREASEQNKKSLDQCEAINAANERAAMRERKKAQEAADRAKMLEAELEQWINKMSSDSQVVSANIESGCPAADDPGFIDWLYREPAGREN